jgi:hypothetical protein
VVLRVCRMPKTSAILGPGRLNILSVSVGRLTPFCLRSRADSGAVNQRELMKKTSISVLPICAVALLLSSCGGGSSSGTAQAQSSGSVPAVKDLSTFANTYWYVPTTYLPAQKYVSIPSHSVTQVNDQTVWHFTSASNGYLFGCAFTTTDNGSNWSVSTLIGSVTINDMVSIGFFGSSLVVGQGQLTTAYSQPAFIMQMSAGSGTAGLTHWAYMLPITSSDANWTNLPGTSAQSVPTVTAAGC